MKNQEPEGYLMTMFRLFVAACLFSYLGMKFKINVLTYISIVCIIAIVFEILVNIEKNNESQNRKEQANIRNNSLSDCGYRRVFYDEKTNIQVYINEKEKKWTYNFSKKNYNFSDVIGCEILENGTTYMKTTTDKKISLGKAFIGGKIFGHTGAIIGGLSGKSYSDTTQTDICTDLKIKITVNDLQNPCIYIYLLHGQIKKEEMTYRSAINKAQNILSIFQVIINNK